MIHTLPTPGLRGTADFESEIALMGEPVKESIRGGANRLRRDGEARAAQGGL